MSIGLKKKTKTSALGVSALAFLGALVGITRGILLDVQQIPDDILRVLHTWLWKYNACDLLIVLMQAFDVDSRC